MSALVDGPYSASISILSQYQDQISARYPAIAETDFWLTDGSMTKQVFDRSPPHLIKSELENIKEWKLKRGKFRPGLLKLVQSNSEEMIISCTTKAFATDSVHGAMSHLTELKGVGPATASAILSGWNQQVPFMADEAMNAIPDLGPIKYSMAFFDKFRDKVAEIRDQVNATAPADAELLSISEISRCLWLSAIMNKSGTKKRPATKSAESRPKKRS